MSIFLPNVEKNFLGLSPEGFHKVFYREWGRSDNPHVVVCVHGLTRNSSDFTFLANVLAEKYRVVCVDMVGRGKSDYLNNPKLYQFPQYLSDLTALLARLQATKIIWVGTSMGGLIGMMMGSQPKTPLNALILNDIGPFVPKEGLKRLAQYATKKQFFTTMDEAKNFLKERFSGYQKASDDQWAFILKENVCWDDESKKFTFSYDPGVSNTIDPKDIKDLVYWDYWNALALPVLALHGTESDILTSVTVEKMAQKKGVQTVSLKGRGHAPSLTETDEIETILRWLQGLKF